MSVRREAPFALAALAGHGVAVLTIALAPHTTPLVVTAPPPEDDLASIDLADDVFLSEPEPEPEPDSPKVDERTIAPRTAKQAPALATLEPLASTEREPAPPSRADATPESDSREAPSTTRFSWTRARHASATELGLGDRNVFLGASPNALVAGAPDATDQHGVQAVMRGDLRDRDVELGLGSGGPVVAAIEESARRSIAELDSRAVFEVTAGEDGAVTGVRLVEASADWPGWESAGAAVRAALAAKRVHVPRGARGVAMTIEVESRNQLPSGNAPAHDVSILGLPVKKSGVKNAIKTDILKPVITVVDARPNLEPLRRAGVTVPEGIGQMRENTEPGDTNNFVKLPGRIEIGFTILGSSADPTDATSRALRVVRARVLREREL
jgi:hypothetical protein